MTKRKVLYLHIGQHKTGTSTIQSFFWRNRHRLEQCGVLYPEVGMSGPTHANLALSVEGRRDEVLATMFENAASDRSGTYAAYDGEGCESLYERLGRQIAGSSCPVIFLSSECFMEWVEPAAIKALFEKHCDCDVKVLLFLRRQDQWIQSVFNQVVKDPGLRYAGRLEELPQMDMLDHERTVDAWSCAFGIKNMIVAPYEDANLYDQGVIGLVAKSLGLHLLKDFEIPTFGEQNKSLNRWQMDILHNLNCRDVSYNYFNRVLGAFSEQNEEFRDSSFSTNSIDFKPAKHLYKQYSRGNKNVARKFLGRKSLFSHPQRSEYPELERAEAEVISDFLIRLDHLGN